jgi:hypothetical protein
LEVNQYSTNPLATDTDSSTCWYLHRGRFGYYYHWSEYWYWIRIWYNN